MYNLSDFSSVLEIAFAFNAILVFFELQKLIEQKYKDINSIGDVISIFIDKKDWHYINTYGWKSHLFIYSIWIGRLKVISIINSILALILLIYSGINPNISFELYSIILLLALLFLPVVLITYILTRGLIKYKIKFMHEAVNCIVTNNWNNISEEELKDQKKKYTILIDFIEFTHFPISSLFKFRKRNFLQEMKTMQEIIEKVQSN